MKRTVAYIDGYNLYYGILKGTPHKWLDPVRLVKALLRDDHELVSVKYFTSPVKTYPHDGAALDRQKVYMQALSTLPNVEIIQGFYRKDAVLMPVHETECKVCPTAKGGLIKVVKLEEKRTDVNIASAMLPCFATTPGRPVVGPYQMAVFQFSAHKGADFWYNFPHGKRSDSDRFTAQAASAPGWQEHLGGNSRALLLRR